MLPHMAKGVCCCLHACYGFVQRGFFTEGGMVPFFFFLMLSSSLQMKLATVIATAIACPYCDSTMITSNLMDVIIALCKCVAGYPLLVSCSGYRSDPTNARNMYKDRTKNSNDMGR